MFHLSIPAFYSKSSSKCPPSNLYLVICFSQSIILYSFSDPWLYHLVSSSSTLSLSCQNARTHTGLLRSIHLLFLSFTHRLISSCFKVCRLFRYFVALWLVSLIPSSCVLFVPFVSLVSNLFYRDKVKYSVQQHFYCIRALPMFPVICFFFFLNSPSNTVAFSCG